MPAAWAVGGAARAAEGVAADRVGPGREHEQDRHERHEHRELAGAQVERRVGHGGPDVAVEHRGDQPQHVHRGEHDRDRADDRPAPALLEDARRGSGTRRRSSTTAARRAPSRRPSSGSSRAPGARAPCRRGARARPSRCGARPSPASRNIDIESSPWLTICSTEPFRPRLVAAKTPNVISPIWASDEYATTPRTSGARKARSEP